MQKIPSKMEQLTFPITSGKQMIKFKNHGHALENVTKFSLVCNSFYKHWHQPAGLARLNGIRPSCHQGVSPPRNLLAPTNLPPREVNSPPLTNNLMILNNKPKRLKFVLPWFLGGELVGGETPLWRDDW